MYGFPDRAKSTMQAVLVCPWVVTLSARGGDSAPLHVILITSMSSVADGTERDFLFERPWTRGLSPRTIRRLVSPCFLAALPSRDLDFDVHVLVVIQVGSSRSGLIIRQLAAGSAIDSVIRLSEHVVIVVHFGAILVEPYFELGHIVLPVI